MNLRTRWSITLIAVIGLVACALVIVGFLLTMANNDLPWNEELSAGDFYRVVGSAYNKGFVNGFFFSFFLVLLAVVVSAWIDSKRRDRRVTDRRQDPPGETSEDSPGKVVAWRR